MEGLKEKDPEFYEFLRKSNKQLLAFGEGMSDDDVGGGSAWEGEGDDEYDDEGGNSEGGGSDEGGDELEGVAGKATKRAQRGDAGKGKKRAEKTKMQESAKKDRKKGAGTICGVQGGAVW